MKRRNKLIQNRSETVAQCGNMSNLKAFKFVVKNRSNLFTKPGHDSYSRLTVVGGRVVGGGGRPEQLALRSLSVPLDVKVTKPGWSLVIWLLIQD